MSGSTFGRYLPLNSWVHQLDPRTKLLLLILVMVAIFIPAGMMAYGILVAYLLVCLWASHLSLGYALKAMKPMLLMMVFLLAVNVFVIKTGYPIQIGSWLIYSDALYQTAYIILRLFLMVVMTTILTTTTKPLDLTFGLERLLKPFEKIGLPTHIMAMMISIALRFIPTLLEEANRILKAQASRGVDIEGGRFKEKMQAVVSLIVPLFVSSYERADQLAVAMIARGYNPDAKRTRYRQLHYTSKDGIAFVVSLLVLIGVILCAI